MDGRWWEVSYWIGTWESLEQNIRVFLIKVGEHW